MVVRQETAHAAWASAAMVLTQEGMMCVGPCPGLLCYCGHGEGRLPLTFSGLKSGRVVLVYAFPFTLESRKRGRDLGWVLQETYLGSLKGRDLDE